MRVLLVLMLSSLGACATTPLQLHDYCQIAKPIYLQKGEAAKLSDATAREILTHNEQWSKICH